MTHESMEIVHIVATDAAAPSYEKRLDCQVPSVDQIHSLFGGTLVAAFDYEQILRRSCFPDPVPEEENSTRHVTAQDRQD